MPRELCNNEQEKETIKAVRHRSSRRPRRARRALMNRLSAHLAGPPAARRPSFSYIAADGDDYILHIHELPAKRN
ncbi:hypothetical protein EVAR_51502_1 [Eumeta japonica]|uniref:Uncharacterized protein n=1 Tax=Eumeta variegata TaxID=151549 RepID=A0A4C1XF58_EUMVA|nr:hypothetical protein EVAR_51502_1 [Eumeta japonica]